LRAGSESTFKQQKIENFLVGFWSGYQ